jgi:uncharacterized DUF497 family protein
MMEVEWEPWDPQKREINLAKHGIDFFDAVRVFDSAHVELSSESNTEERFLTIGIAEWIVLTVVWTWRDGIRRIISARPASRKERCLYYEFINSIET